MCGYIGPLRHDRLRRFYGPLVRWTMRESAFRRALLAQVAQDRPRRVLDLGCGTGTFTIALARALPGAIVVGLDANPEALHVAGAKARRVLAVGGSLHVADQGRPSSAPMRLLFLAVQLLEGFETTRDSVAGALPGLARSAGFSAVQETASFATPVGTMRLLRAT